MKRINKNVKFEEFIVVGCTAEQVFDYTQDYDNRLNWDSFLRKAHVVDKDKKAGLGVKTYCETKHGLGMTTKYISFNRPKTTAIKMTKGPFLFRSFLGSWTFKALENQKTKVTFLYSFQLHFLFWPMNRLMKVILRLHVKARLQDLKKAIEELTF